MFLTFDFRDVVDSKFYFKKIFARVSEKLFYKLRVPHFLKKYKEMFY